MSSNDVTLLGRPALDMTVKTIADFLLEYMHLDGLEIEAKFGQIIDRNTNKRLLLPVKTDAVLLLPQDLPHEQSAYIPQIRFSAEMDASLHKRFNQLLNDRVSKLASHGPSMPSLQYKHHRVIDESYSMPGAGRKRVRITKDGTSNSVIAAITKEKLADLHIYAPYSPLDCRISVSVETPLDSPPSNLPHPPQSFRYKDRLSYTFNGEFVLDLSQVKSGNSSTPSSSINVSNELELEILDPSGPLREEWQKCMRKEPNHYIDIVKRFVDNIKVILNKA